MSPSSYTLRIRRYNTETGRSEPWWDEFRLEMEPSERVLDALARIKDTLDGTLTFRRSCAHGVCGSCAMKINGRNALACQTLMKDLPDEITLEPLPALRVIKDLVVDMDKFFGNNDQVMPYLINDGPVCERERTQSPEEQQRIVESITCIMCGACTTSCPSFWHDGNYLGPSALLKAYRFVFDSRDRAEKRRLDRVSAPDGLWRCHSIFNCVTVCPKGIDITRHIAALKRRAFSSAFR